MNEMFLLKMGEIVLKGLNRASFEGKLHSNLSRRLKPYGRFKIRLLQSTVYVEPENDDCDLDGAWEACGRVFGIISRCRSRGCDKDLDAIFNACRDYLGDEIACAKSFKVESKRADKRFPLNSIQISQEIGGRLAEEYPQVEVLMGTSTAGIAHAAIVGHMMKLPMGYVRGSSKDHGRQNQIEGRLEKGQKVVVVEDLVSTGGSVLDVVKVLRAAGAEVLGVVSIFTYGMKKGLERLAAANVKNVSLTNFDVIAAVAAEQNYIKQEDVVRLIQFRNNPADESWIGGNN